MRNHTLGSIAESYGVNKRAAQNWLAQAKADHGEIGEIQGKTRYFSDSERKILLSYAGDPRRKAKPARIPEILPPAGYADPFAGVSNGGVMVPAGFQAQNRSLATSAAAQRVQQLCQGANLHAQQTVAAALDSGDQMGQQLGAFLAERTIAAAEQQRQALIQQYLQAQGVQVDPKPQAAPDGQVA